MNDFDRARADFRLAIQRQDHPFAATLAFVDQWFDYSPSAFSNGPVSNAADQNQGSCKVFALARLLDLDRDEALRCFGEHYREVLATPDADNHRNLRQLQAAGLDAVAFDAFPLRRKGQG
ncbi:MAG: HopJ type III effector protein [Pseudomonadota bacterium]|nr:HopJ type III effector protein [Pseudomonadota bacterium]